VSCYRWKYKNKEIDSGVYAKIKAVTGSGIIASLLINRGITCPDRAKEFLDPDSIEISPPHIFEDMQKAVDKINDSIEKQERIVVFGDFDADGVTSASLLYKTLKYLGANVDYYIPDRIEEGHGLNRAGICKLISQEKAKLIITTDCGISNLAEIKLAKSLGTEVIITDHHEPPEEVPDAYAIINPKMLDKDPTGLKYLAGVGVAYKLAQALLEANGKKEFEEELLHLVAIGTVGDVVPLLGENRALVHQGLELISRKKPPAIAKILETAGYKPDKQINSGMVAFGIVPRINAIGRLSGANPAVELLTTDDEAQVNHLAEELDRNNKERQQICEETFKRAEDKIFTEIDLDRHKALILADRDWHPGIVGIVASKLVEKYYRPVLMLSIDEAAREGRCSARSVDSLNLYDTLTNFSEYFIHFGGHSLAAGFAFSLDKISFEGLRSLIMNYINNVLEFEDLSPELKLDMDIEPADLTIDFIQELDRLAPFGESNPYPVFAIPNLTLRSCTPLGQKKNHLKIMLSDDRNNVMEAVWWQKKELDIEVAERVDVAFVPSVNNYMDRQRIQLVIKDIRRASERNSKKIDVEKCKLPEIPIDPIEIEPIDYTKTETNINWVDHRQETGFKKDFLEYLNSRGDKVSIFAESQRAKEILENVSSLKPLAVNRMNVKAAECMVFLDLPADDMSFMNVIKQADPVEIHMFGLVNGYEPVELIKKISGMLKYAHNEKDGVINVERAASVLAVSSELYLACVELLDSAGVVEIVEITENSIEFSFKGSVDLSRIQGLPEYLNFLNVLQEFENYKTEYKTKDIELVKQTLSDCCSLLEVK